MKYLRWFVTPLSQMSRHDLVMFALFVFILNVPIAWISLALGFWWLSIIVITIGNVYIWMIALEMNKR